MEQEAACPAQPAEFSIFPPAPVFGPTMTWDEWGDANQNWGIALAQRILAREKWRAEHWKNCKLP